MIQKLKDKRKKTSERRAKQKIHGNLKAPSNNIKSCKTNSRCKSSSDTISRSSEIQSHLLKNLNDIFSPDTEENSGLKCDQNEFKATSTPYTSQIDIPLPIDTPVAQNIQAPINYESLKPELPIKKKEKPLALKLASRIINQHAVQKSKVSNYNSKEQQSKPANLPGTYKPVLSTAVIDLKDHRKSHNLEHKGKIGTSVNALKVTNFVPDSGTFTSVVNKESPSLPRWQKKGTGCVPNMTKRKSTKVLGSSTNVRKKRTAKGTNQQKKNTPTEIVVKPVSLYQSLLNMCLQGKDPIDLLI